MSWTLIERLDPSVSPSLVWADGHPRTWKPTKQLVRGTGLARKELAILLDALTVPPAAFTVREREPVIDIELPRRTGEWALRIIVHHVVAPDDSVVGILVWIAPTSTKVEPRPRAAGMIWDTEGTRRMWSSEDTWMLRSNRVEDYEPIRDVDQFFAQIVRFPDLPRIVALANSAEDHAEPVQTKVALLHDEFNLVNLQVVAKRVGSQVIGCALDITQWDPTEMDPLIAVRSQGLLLTDSSRAILAFRPLNGELPTPEILYWVTSPPPAVAYWSEGGPAARGKSTLIHPDDHAALRSAQAELSRHQQATASVRLCGRTDEWITTNVSLQPYPSTTVPLYIAVFSPPTDTRTRTW